MSLGQIMVGLTGLSVTSEEKALLRRPGVGGVILFGRNVQSPTQVEELCRTIHGLRSPPLLIAVDQEGGRVQRMKEGFTLLPPVAALGRLFDVNPARAREAATETGWLMASELRAVGVDLSFTPVLDLDRGVSEVIGDRAFHKDPEIVGDLAACYVRGMREAGMCAVGKHFPGHGSVVADSHREVPTDDRDAGTIFMEDLVPFQRLIDGGLEAVMMSHVHYPAIDSALASFSKVWIRDVLRRRLGFQGVVFSDDLGMGAAAVAGGDFPQRAFAALTAGVDMVLICNLPDEAHAVVDAAREPDPASSMRLARLHGRGAPPTLDELRSSARWRNAVAALREYDDRPSLDLEL